MEYDLIVRNGMLVDGTGLPRRRVDVGVRQGKIAKLGRLDDATAREEIDAKGRIVAPGIVDAHTHYDPQITFDPYATMSCFHGVTTVLAGNCGFSAAPVKAKDLEFLKGVFARVEDMDPAALGGVRWDQFEIGDLLRHLWDAPIFHPTAGAFALSEPQMLTGLVFGCINGYLVGYMRLRAFLTTLVTLVIGRAIYDILVVNFGSMIQLSSASSVWTQNLNRAHRVARAVGARAGDVRARPAARAGRGADQQLRGAAFHLRVREARYTRFQDDLIARLERKP